MAPMLRVSTYFNQPSTTDDRMVRQIAAGGDSGQEQSSHLAVVVDAAQRAGTGFALGGTNPEYPWVAMTDDVGRFKRFGLTVWQRPAAWPGSPPASPPGPAFRRGR
jgi:hypothetical protein